MKFLPDALGRKIGASSLMASENAPKLLFVGGVVGMVGSTVLACRATLKVSDILDRIEDEKNNHEMVKTSVDEGTAREGTTYSDDEYRHDIRAITLKGAGSIARLYAPAVLLGGASIFALTKSHNLLQDRNLALTAAYAAVDTAFGRYRERVVDRYGEEVDRELRYDTEDVDVVDEETGEVETKTQITGAPGSRYARWYDGESSRNWSENFEVNKLALRNVQNYANDMLKSRGHLVLNEVFTELGMSHTNEGAVVGWRWQKNSGDDYIDFGIFWRNQELNDQFNEAHHNGREGAILLDFNVDGVIYGKIEEEES